MIFKQAQKIAQSAIILYQNKYFVGVCNISFTAGLPENFPF